MFSANTKYAKLESGEYSTIYFNDFRRKDLIGQPHFGICDYIILFLAYTVWFCTLPITWCFSFKVIPQYQRAIVSRLGRVLPLKGPGLIIIIPLIDQWHAVDMRMKAFSVPPQEIVTIDHGVFKVGADVQYRISNPIAMHTFIRDINHSLRVTGHTALSTQLSGQKLSYIQNEKHFIEGKLLSHMNKAVCEWGIEISRFQLTQSVVIKTSGDLDPSESEDCNGVSAIMDVFKSLTSSSSHTVGLSKAKLLSQSPNNQPNENMLSPRELFCISKSVIDDQLCSQINAVYEFHVTENNQSHVWTIDLKNSPGCVVSGSAAVRVDVKLETDSKVLQSIFYGSLSPMQAYTNGSLVVHGSLQTAARLEYLVRRLKKV